MCSSALWVASVDTHRKKVSLKWVISGLKLKPLSLLSTSMILEKCKFCRMSLNLDLFSDLPCFPMYCPHYQQLDMVGSLLTLRVNIFIKKIRKNIGQITVLVCSNTSVHLDAKNKTSFTQNVVQNLMNMVAASKSKWKGLTTENSEQKIENWKSCILKD